jgi:hypothetical protein
VLVGGCGDNLAPPDAAPVRVVEVRHGTTGFGTSAEVQLPVAVEPAHSFLLFGSGVNDITATSTLVRGQLLDAQRLRFVRAGFGAGPAAANWTVVELDPASTVQRGTVEGGVTSIEIAPVDRRASFIIASASASGADLANEDFFRIGFADDDTLEVMPALDGTPTIDWQVVSIPGAAVLHGTLEMTGAVATLDLPPGNYDHAFVLASWSIAPPETGFIGPDFVTAGLVGARLVVERAVAGSPITVAYQVISLPGARVIRGFTVPDAAALIYSVTPAETWTPGRAFALTGSMNNGGITTFVGDSATDNPGGALFTTDIADGTRVRFVREATYPAGTVTTVRYQIVELPFAMP